jgi:branched-chain amino acid transport system ATP-binding protein
MTSPLISVSNISKQFLGLRAVDGINLAINQGEIVSIIGPNGAGKTTLFNLLTGQLAPTEGEVRLRGQVINHLTPNARARRGIGRTFQIAKPLVSLSALENVMVGAFLHHPRLSDAQHKAMQVLRRVGLERHAHHRAGELTLSEWRWLEVARALALEPDVMLLDEVMAGLNQSEVAQAIDLFQGLHAEGLTFLIIEHNLKVVRAFSKRVVVLDRGQLIAEGSADEILSSPEVVAAYLGDGHQWTPS